MIVIHWLVTIYWTCLFGLFCFCLFILFCFVFFSAVINIANTERKKDQKKKVLFGKGTKGNVFFERSTNTWAFFCDRLPRIVFGFSEESEQLHIHFLKSWQFCTHTRAARAFHHFHAFLFLVKLNERRHRLIFHFLFV